MANSFALMASAGTIDGIRDCIQRFYCGESKTLIPTGADSWKLVHTIDGKALDAVRVVRKRNRFRFEMDMTAA
jgi:hypothetical protein